jgi:hypothetical protein
LIDQLGSEELTTAVVLYIRSVDDGSKLCEAKSDSGDPISAEDSWPHATRCVVVGVGLLVDMGDVGMLDAFTPDKELLLPLKFFTWFRACMEEGEVDGDVITGELEPCEDESLDGRRVLSDVLCEARMSFSVSRSLLVNDIAGLRALA